MTDQIVVKYIYDRYAIVVGTGSARCRMFRQGDTAATVQLEAARQWPLFRRAETFSCVIRRHVASRCALRASVGCNMRGPTVD